MMKKPLLLAALLAGATLLQGCVPAALVGGAAVGVMTAHDRRSTGTITDDETTEWKALGIVPAPAKETAHVNATAYNRSVLLTGEVPDDEVKQQVGAQAAGLPGVRQVHNELVIGTASTLSQRSNDTYITSKVKARLVDSKQISANHVKVVTERGVTFLMGIVTDYEAKVAIQVARTTAGVLRVVNVLEVLPESDIRRIDSQVLGTAPSAPAHPAPVESR